MDMESRIVSSFLRLLDKHKPSQISVDQIILEAGISRSTFYRCFSSKADILYSAFAEVPRRAVITSVGKPFEEMLVDYYRTLDLDKKRFLKILRSDVNYEFHRSVFHYNIDYFSSALRYVHKEATVTSAELSFLCSGLTTVTLQWLDGTLPLSPEDAGRENFRLIPEHIREVVQFQAGWLENNMVRTNAGTVTKR